MTDPIAAEARSVESGLRALADPDGTYRVKCQGSCRGWAKHHVVRVGMTERAYGWRLHLSCDCPAGTSKPSEPTPCMHAATVGRGLEREGWVRWDQGAWMMTDEGLTRLRAVMAMPKMHTGKGRCAICNTFLTVHFTDQDNVKEVAARHNPKCHAAYVERWDRTQKLMDSYEAEGGDISDLLYGPEKS